MELLEQSLWLVLFLPLAAATVIGLFTQKNQRLSAGISIGAVAIAFVLSLVLFFAVGKVNVTHNWLSVGDLKVDIGLKLDSLSGLMLLVVTGVGLMIHVYSAGYMHGDRCYSRYFASLSLFVFSMLGIVLADNFLMMFIFWELVGVSSYLLIGFWYEKSSAGDASKKAFLTNRIGDFGFILGILIVWATLGSLNFDMLTTRMELNPQALGGLATAAGLLIFCGAMGKSAQFPLHVWLPDAMEGPTPVSALIHAATMVAAGVYMLCRVFFLFTPEALHVIAWIGGVTALIAALMAVQQNDIKRIFAYSTLSQLGYMVMAVGLAAPAAAMFHLTTHAFFKAMLFLGAGSVIHAMHHEQDIWKMGGLRHKMPTTYKTFLLGTLALCGVWPLSGFYSKDGILASAIHDGHVNVLLFMLAVGVAVLTTFYMSRLVLVTFFGPERSEEAGHAHESPSIMTVPLLILAVPSAIGGFIGIDALFNHFFKVEGTGHHGFMDQLFHGFNHSPVAAFSGLAAVLAGGALAWAFYGNAKSDPLPEKLGFFARAMRNRFYFDEIYAWIIAHTHDAIARFCDALDRWIIAGLLVRGTHGTTEIFGRALRLVQTGNLQTYAFLFALGVALVLLLALKF